MNKNLTRAGQIMRRLSAILWLCGRFFPLDLTPFGRADERPEAGVQRQGSRRLGADPGPPGFYVKYGLLSRAFSNRRVPLLKNYEHFVLEMEWKQSKVGHPGLFVWSDASCSRGSPPPPPPKKKEKKKTILLALKWQVLNGLNSCKSHTVV